jgi:hypothetical protein
LDHDPSGNGSSSGYGQVDAEFFTELQEAGNGALTAPTAVVDIVGQSIFAPAVLQAVGHEKEDFLWGVPATFRGHDLVVHPNKRTPDFLLGYAHAFAHNGHQGEEAFDRYAPYSAGKENWSFAQDV